MKTWDGEKESPRARQIDIQTERKREILQMYICFVCVIDFSQWKLILLLTNPAISHIMPCTCTALKYVFFFKRKNFIRYYTSRHLDWFFFSKKKEFGFSWYRHWYHKSIIPFKKKNYCFKTCQIILFKMKYIL